MKHENMNLEKLTIEEMETLKAILDKLRKDDTKYEWEDEPPLKDGEQYYYVSQDGNVCRSTWQFGKADWIKFHLNNTFKTEKEAKFEIEKRKILAKLKRYSKWCWEQSGMSEKEAWKDNDLTKYTIQYQTEKEEVIIGMWIQYKDMNCIYFPTIEDTKKAIEMIGEENIKKYLFLAGE